MAARNGPGRRSQTQMRKRNYFGLTLESKKANTIAGSSAFPG